MVAQKEIRGHTVNSFCQKLSALDKTQTATMERRGIHFLTCQVKKVNQVKFS